MTKINLLDPGDFFKDEGVLYQFLDEKDDKTRDFLCFNQSEMVIQQFSPGYEVEKINVRLVKKEG